MSTPRYTPTTCPKCSATRDPGQGRPTRWCSEGCKRSGEAEMTRLQTLLRKAEEGRLVEALNGRTNAHRVQALTVMQARFDHLAGVPSSAVQ
jgi:hypothetical protein